MKPNLFYYDNMSRYNEFNDILMRMDLCKKNISRKTKKKGITEWGGGGDDKNKKKGQNVRKLKK